MLPKEVRQVFASAKARLIREAAAEVRKSLDDMKEEGSGNFFVPSGIDYGPQGRAHDKLSDYLDSQISEWNGSEDWAALVLSIDGELCSYAGYEGRMMSASLIKLFVAGAYLEGLERGDYPRSYLPRMDVMISDSSNEACNELISLMGMDEINCFIKENGFADTLLQRRMLADRTNENFTSVKDVVRVLLEIYRGEYVSKEGSLRLLSDLKAQTHRNKIPSGLPDSAMCANKTGELSDVENDAAIIWSSTGPYIMCVMSSHVQPGRAQGRIRELASTVYEILTDEPEHESDGSETEEDESEEDESGEDEYEETWSAEDEYDETGSDDGSEPDGDEYRGPEEAASDSLESVFLRIEEFVQQSPEW